MGRVSHTVGIVGLGFGRAHIPAFQAHGCQVVAVCQRDQKAARAVADRYGVPRVFDRWEQMLEQARPDIVVIAAPPALHRVIAVEALAAGAHVLCEKPLDTEDYCAVTAELTSGAQVTLTVSRAARGASEQTLEAYGSDGALQYRLNRETPRWWRGELRAAAKESGFVPVKVPAGLPKSAGEGDPLEVTGKTTIAPLVKRFLAGIRKEQSPSPSFEDGMRAQAVLDAVLESIASGGGMVSI